MWPLRVILLQVLIALAMLASLEAAARVAYTVHLNLTRETKWFVFSSDTGWDRRPFFNGFDDCGKHRAFGRQGFLLNDVPRLQHTRPGQFRALFVGDSTTYGYCLEEDDTLVEAANRLNPNASSISLGVPGYTSYQGYRALEKYGDHIKPDIVLISFNFNDRRLVLEPALADGEAAFERLYRSDLAQQFAEFSYLFSAARYIAQKISPPGPAASGYVTNARLDKLRPRVDATGYRQNLTNMVLWAQQRGIAVALILLGDNPDQTYLLREGIGLLSEGRYEEAIAKLNAARDEWEDYTFSALVHLHLAKAYEGARRSDEAQQALDMKDVFAGVHGGYPIVLDTEYHQIMREVGARYDIRIIDAATELNKNADVYFDQCHFDDRGQEIVGRLAIEAIEMARSKRPDAKR